MKIAIIESGGANFLSVTAALEHLDVECQVTHDANTIRSTDAVILPGVGSAGFAMQVLKDFELCSVIRDLKQPVLGICLGMQLLYEHSAEDDVDCLGIIPGRIEKFSGENLIVPHMGWNNLTKCQTDPIMADINDTDDVYFVHSYYAAIDSATIASCNYGCGFSAIVKHKNFYGMQFHPEKSGEIGAKLLTNFIGIANANLSSN